MSARTAALTAPPKDELLERRLPSGRSLLVRMNDGAEEIEIRAQGGAVECRIAFTSAGPVVSVRGARLEVESPEVAFRCRTFAVQASEQVSLASEQAVQIQADEVFARSKRDIHLNGAFIRLNCTDSGQEAPALPDAAGPAARGGCCDPAGQ